MHLIQYNFSWMTVNIFLAVLPVILGWIFYVVKNKAVKVLFGIIWLVLLPNSIYLFTDLFNLIKQWPLVGSAERLVFIFQYGVLTTIGYITFILSMYPFENFLIASDWIKKRGGPNKYLIILNFIIGFGITLGRVQRVNSWDVIFDPFRIIASSLEILIKPDLLLLTILFGLFSNSFYFLLRKSAIRYFKNYLSQVGFLR